VIKTVEQRLPDQSCGEQPSVSVVLVTYNRAHLLDATLESILSQTISDFELIIADDASCDETPEVCRRWIESRQVNFGGFSGLGRSLRTRGGEVLGRQGHFVRVAPTPIRYLRRPHNLGMPQNLNLGILASTGKYVAILHDDNLYSPDLLKEWKTCLDEHPKAAFVFNAYRALDACGQTRTVYREVLPRCSPGSVLLERIFFKRWRFGSPVFGTVMMRRSAFDHAGSFDQRFGFWADVDMWMRLAEDFDVCYIDKPLITVTSSESAPHQFDDREEVARPLLERMFWEARMRHYRQRPARRSAEAVRHWGYVAANRT
jgi:glycosyltransferase involved in cell wall biosynthesis